MSVLQSASDKEMAGGQEYQRECVILLVLFGKSPYVKVLIYLLLFQEYQEYQLSLPGTLRWQVDTLGGLTSAAGNHKQSGLEFGLDDVGPAT